MSPVITAFERSPDGGRGLARDMRVRWALEEVGQPYEVCLVSFSAMKGTAHRTRHPFGQIPRYEDGDLVLFESGAIVLRIAEHHAGLLPDDANVRARAIAWLAALDTAEPPIPELVIAKFLEGDEPWAAQRMPLVEGRIHARLGELSEAPGDADWLAGGFSAGDLMRCRCCCDCAGRVCWTPVRISRPTSREARRGPRTDGRSRRSSRS